MEELCKFDQGMVLFAGVTGSGKSTTIASMLDWVNGQHRKHILTIEDPIEFVYTQDKCLINQREVGIDVKDFETAMKRAVPWGFPTSCWWVKCVTWKRSRPPCMPPKRGTWSSERFTLRMHRAPSAVFWTCFPGHALGLAEQHGLQSAGHRRTKAAQDHRRHPQGVPSIEIMPINPTVRKLILEGEG